MPPKLRVLAHNARLDERLQSDISTSLRSVLRTNPRMTPKEAMYSIEQELLANNPYQPPKDGKCPINDLPNEILGYIFQVGVRIQEEEEMDEYNSDEGDDEWEDMSTDDEDDEEDEEAGPSSGGPLIEPYDTSDSDSDSDSDAPYTDSDDEDEVNIPFQVLASHVCRRWREVALDSHVLWTTLSFTHRPNIEKAKMYISRAEGLPLNLFIDCTFPEDVDEEDHPDHPLYLENKATRKANCEAECTHHDEHDDDDDADAEVPQFLSQKELSQILDVVEPEVSHWRALDFRASTYGYVHLLLSRLHQLPAAPLLESFQVYHFEDCEDYEFFSGDDKTPFLPFHGVAPNLKDAMFWGVHIDWEGALPGFLRGLRELELSYHAKDVRPTYSAFSQMIKNSPELQTITLSLSGPILTDGAAFDDEEEWGPVPLTIPSLREFALQFQDPKYASAIVQHFDMPEVRNLVLNFDEQDYSEFVQALLKPVKGRTESLLQHIEHLKIAGLPCDVASVEGFLGQLGRLKTLNLKVVGDEEGVIFEKLINPAASRPTTAAASTAASEPSTTTVMATGSSAPTTPPGTTSYGALPKLFCPQLESVTTTEVSGSQIKQLIIARRKLGAPLKKILMSQSDHISKKEEKWIRENVEALDFFEPSDSEDEVEFEIVADDEDDDEDDEGHDGDDNDDDDDGSENGGDEPFPSPLARHLGRGSMRRRNRGMDLD